MEEGFECEDVNFVYKIGKSKYGLWLSRNRKDKMTTTSNNNGPNNESNNENNRSNGDISGPLSPAAFLNNDNNNNESITATQQQQQQPQQQQVVYPVSVKLEVDSKGYVKPSVHLYGYDSDKTVSETVRLFFEVKSQIIERGGKVLEA